MSSWPLVVFFGLIALLIWFHKCDELDKRFSHKRLRKKLLAGGHYGTQQKIVSRGKR